jgi:hypothetical protein
MFERAPWKECKPGPIVYCPDANPARQPSISELDNTDSDSEN